MLAIVIIVVRYRSVFGPLRVWLLKMGLLNLLFLLHKTCCCL